MYWYFSIPATCSDGTQNQGETGVDIGGPCPLLDINTVQQQATLWARSFKVRDGTYTGAAYVQNANKNAGVARVRYHFSLYDPQNLLVAERTGETFIMPQGITPILESRIDTGSRVVAHTYFEFTEPLAWERMSNAATALVVGNKQLSDVGTLPRLTATVQNNAVVAVNGAAFVAIMFDPAGNAFAASETNLDRLEAGESAQIIFTWPDAFPVQVGRIDIIPLLPPAPESVAS